MTTTLILIAAMSIQRAPIERVVTISQPSISVRQTDYATYINRGRELLSSDPNAAFLAGISALALNSAGWEASWLCADAQMALGLNMSAKDFFEQALATAPATARELILKSMNAENRNASSSELARQADAVYAEGLRGKAATLYARAFRADRTKPDYAFRAMQIWKEVKEVLPLSRIYAELVEAGLQGDLVDQCKQIYSDYQVSQTRYAIQEKILVDAGKARFNKNDALALENLEILRSMGVGETIDSRVSFGFVKAAVYLDQGLYTKGIEELRRVAKLAPIDENLAIQRGGYGHYLLYLIPRDRISQLFNDLGIQSFLKDASGEATLQELIKKLEWVVQEGGSYSISGDQYKYRIINPYLHEAIKERDTGKVLMAWNIEIPTSGLDQVLRTATDLRFFDSDGLSLSSFETLASQADSLEVLNTLFDIRKIPEESRLKRIADSAFRYSGIPEYQHLLRTLEKYISSSEVKVDYLTLVKQFIALAPKGESATPLIDKFLDKSDLSTNDFSLLLRSYVTNSLNLDRRSISVGNQPSLILVKSLFRRGASPFFKPNSDLSSVFHKMCASGYNNGNLDLIKECLLQPGAKEALNIKFKGMKPLDHLKSNARIYYDIQEWLKTVRLS